MRTFYVYILASESRILYIGVTNDLERRLYEHKTSDASRFTATYRVDRLVYFEETTDITAAIEREKQLKGWRREKKIALIERANPNWFDLSDRWFNGQPIGENGVLSVSRQDPSTAPGTASLRGCLRSDGLPHSGRPEGARFDTLIWKSVPSGQPLRGKINFLDTLSG